MKKYEEMTSQEFEEEGERLRKREKEFWQKKFILDACCGGKMFWYDRNHPNVIFQDIRKKERGFVKYSPGYSVNPDIVGDFRKMDFPDESFKLVVFDPPHLIEKGTSIMSKKYGFFGGIGELKKDIKKGFDECWRVLEDYGVLIFKWNEASIKRKEIIEIIGKEPLFGQTGASNKDKICTIWFCFMKIPPYIATESLGRKWIGCDISEKYCQIGEERLKILRSQPKLLIP